ncbi:MAG: hypothetical protein QNK15_00030, partial [Cycloclasticus sp.]|nr:hypothetical protein [Cycloclasticus sp.]
GIIRVRVKLNILLKQIKASVNKGLALGNERFAHQIEALTEKRVTTRKVGRPKRKLGDEI